MTLSKTGRAAPDKYGTGSGSDRIVATYMKALLVRRFLINHHPVATAPGSVFVRRYFACQYFVDAYSQNPSVDAGLEVDVFIWLTFYCAFTEEAVKEDLGWIKGLRLPTPIHFVDEDSVLDEGPGSLSSPPTSVVTRHCS
jgi:hypothetical protein